MIKGFSFICFKHIKQHNFLLTSLVFLQSYTFHPVVKLPLLCVLTNNLNNLCELKAGVTGDASIAVKQV